LREGQLAALVADAQEGLGERACPVVAIVKRSSGATGDPGVEFTTDAGRTRTSTRGDFEAEFGAVVVAQDDGRECWIMREPDGRTMQVGGIEPSSLVPTMIGVMGANRSMRFAPTADWSACAAVVNGAAETV